ncbi:hypothetical protein [Ferrovum sp.]|uniref:hypothetical protein n=1 Tax=Ferrovum sp. TaxID=2609467 RepID=UPI002624A46B|nr:hypothetical protein [Ferrovum sp.]
MSKIYFDKDGRKIQKDKWTHYRMDPSYCIVREFRNKAVLVIVEWKGAVDTRLHPFAFTHPTFEMRVWNFDSDGKLVPDPVESKKTFPSEQNAINAYNNFLLRWTDSKIENGELVEVGNELTPPPPPDPNIPKTAVNDDIGCW